MNGYFRCASKDEQFFSQFTDGWQPSAQELRSAMTFAI